VTRAQVAASARAAAEEALDRMRGEKFEPTGEQFKPSTINHAVAVRDTHFADLLDAIDQWETADSGGQGGGPRRFGYALLLLGMILVAENNMPMWATSIAEALWYMIPEDRHAELGIPPLPACTAEGCSGKGCRHPFEAAARTVRTRLRSLERLVDPWGYPINQRLTPDEFDARCRVYAPGERDRNYRRLNWLMNQVVEAALRQAPRDLMGSWDGSSTVDETPIRANARMPRTVEDKTKPKRNGRHPRKIERHSTDPSAGPYVRDTKVMHAWNLTMVVMASGVSDEGLLLRPSLCLAVAPLALPGTGAVDAALNACHDAAARGWLVTFLSNDRLYTNSRPELYQHPAMVELGISFIHDYRYDQLGTQDTYGGLVLVEGGVYCADMPDSLINAVKDFRDGLIDFDTCRARVAERAGYAARLKAVADPDGHQQRRPDRPRRHHRRSCLLRPGQPHPPRRGRHALGQVPPATPVLRRPVVHPVPVRAQHHGRPQRLRQGPRPREPRRSRPPPHARRRPQQHLRRLPRLRRQRPQDPQLHRLRRGHQHPVGPLGHPPAPQAQRHRRDHPAPRADPPPPPRRRPLTPP